MASTNRRSALWIHLVTLPRWFALPAALGPVLLGYFASGVSSQGSELNLALALLAASFLMASLHCWNSVADWVSGVDKPGGSVEKSYSSGSQVLPRGWAPLWAVILNALGFFALAVGATEWLSYRTDSLWPWFGFGMGFIFGAFYAPVWKYFGVPEIACGLLGFGVGGVSIGMAVSGHVPLKEAFLMGIAVSIPFAISWGVDQSVDAASDIKRGVRNIGGLLYVTGFPTWAYTGLGALLSYIVVVYLISIEVFPAWAGLVLLTFPAWILCLAWLHASEHPTRMRPDKEHNLDTGVFWGLAAIFLHTGLLVVAVAV